MKKNVSNKAVYLKPEVELIQVYSEVHFLAGSVTAETESESVGNIFGSQQGQNAKKFGSLWEDDFEEYNNGWKISTDDNE